jgi:ribosomal protein S18 acetylase RimI-like enzyme
VVKRIVESSAGGARLFNTVISLRPEQPGDEALLRQIYESARAAEMEIAPWISARKQQFLTMQFALQRADFRRHYPNASYDIVLENDSPVGRLYVDRAKDEIRVLDIALLPAHRGKGTGSRLLRALLTESESAGIPVRLLVERNKPALRLYNRLGFRETADRGVYVELEWRRAEQ